MEGEVSGACAEVCAEKVGAGPSGWSRLGTQARVITLATPMSYSTPLMASTIGWPPCLHFSHAPSLHPSYRHCVLEASALLIHACGPGAISHSC